MLWDPLVPLELLALRVRLALLDPRDLKALLALPVPRGNWALRGLLAQQGLRAQKDLRATKETPVLKELKALQVQLVSREHKGQLV